MDRYKQKAKQIKLTDPSNFIGVIFTVPVIKHQVRTLGNKSTSLTKADYLRMNNEEIRQARKQSR